VKCDQNSESSGAASFEMPIEVYISTAKQIYTVIVKIHVSTKKQSALCLVPPSPRVCFSTDALGAAPAGFVR
jgi:hypothetical protein